jgi:hypothetical protein
MMFFVQSTVELTKIEEPAAIINVGMDTERHSGIPARIAAARCRITKDGRMRHEFDPTQMVTVTLTIQRLIERRHSFVMI